MHRSFATLARVVAAFSSTNLDDSLLLAGLFVGVEFSPRSVIVGQFIGMGIVVLASLAAALLAVTSPGGWPALLGFVPLLLRPARFWNAEELSPRTWTAEERGRGVRALRRSSA